MAGGRYNIILATDRGSPILSLNRNSYLTASRVVNGVGRLELHTAVDFAREYLKRDRQIIVMRAAPGNVYRLFSIYFLRRWRRERNKGKQLVKLWGYCPNSLIARRLCVGYEFSATTLLTDQAGDMMKYLMTQALLDTDEPVPDVGTRDWPDFNIGPSLSDGPILTMDLPFKQLFGLSGGGAFTDIVNAATAEGTPIFFDVVPTIASPTSTAFTLHTYTGQPGQDLTGAVVLDEARGTIADPYIDEDYSKEITYIYAGGKGAEEDQEVTQVYDAERYTASAWNRIEGFRDAATQEGDGVREEARSYLNDARPIVKAGGDILDTPSCRFGVHWWHGDRVRFRYDDQEFDAIVRNTVLIKRGGKETITAKVESINV